MARLLTLYAKPKAVNPTLIILRHRLVVIFPLLIPALLHSIKPPMLPISQREPHPSYGDRRLRDLWTRPHGEAGLPGALPD